MFDLRYWGFITLFDLCFFFKFSVVKQKNVLFLDVFKTVYIYVFHSYMFLNNVLLNNCIDNPVIQPVNSSF